MPALASEDHAFFLEHGYVIVRHGVPPDIIADAIRFLGGAAFAGDVGAANYRPLHGDAVDACLTPRVWDAIGELFGPELPFHRGGASDMPRPYWPDVPWKSQDVHVDDDYPTLMPAGWALGLFLFLTPVRSHGGAFRYAPGSPWRYRDAARDAPETLAHLAREPLLSDPVHEFLAEPGDLLLFHHLMGHAGSDNVTDPQTRHALLGRYHPHARIVPGRKPFDQMSTVEKANSARYLSETGKIGTLAALPDDDTLLRDGLSAPGGIVTYAFQWFNCSPYALLVSGDKPTTVQSAPLWSENANSFDLLTLPIAIDSLLGYERDPGLTLFVGRGGQTEVFMGGGHKPVSTTTLATAPYASGHYTTDFGSKTARGRVVFTSPPDAPNEIHACWGATWESAVGHAQNFLVGTLPAGSTVTEAQVKPTLGEEAFCLVADAREPDGTTRAYFARSRDSARYPDAPRPFAHTGDDAPRQMRVAARARDFWLVTYLTGVGQNTRLFWGQVDWQAAPGVLQPISTMDALQAALAVVGLL